MGDDRTNAAARDLVLRLRDERGRLGMTQRAVGKAMGTQQSTISDWDTGEVSPTLGRFVEYARVLGFEVLLVPKADAAIVGDARELLSAAERVAAAAGELHKAAEVMRWRIQWDPRQETHDGR